MKAILTYAACRGTELLYCENRTEKLKHDSWLAKLIRDKYEDKLIVFLGKNDKKRVDLISPCGSIRVFQGKPKPWDAPTSY